METVWDWLALGLFAGLVVLLLQRSMEPEPSDRLWQYLPAAVGCAGANALGNNDYGIIAALLLAGTVAYIFYILKPFGRHGS